jgi:hypothetical protein
MEKRRTHGEVVENGMSNYYLAFDKLFDFCSNDFEEWCYPSAYILFHASRLHRVSVPVENVTIN